MRLCMITLILFLIGLSSLSRAETSDISPADVITAQGLDLSPFSTWCSSDPTVKIETISQGGCQFHPVRDQIDLTHGLSHEAFWLRFSLYNPTDAAVERWLRVGNPRLQSVTLYSRANGSAWKEVNTGLNVPAKDRPILAEIPLLPIEIMPHTTGTYYIRVISATAIDLSSELLPPRAYLESSQLNRILFYMSLGATSLALIFCFITYAQLRQISLLFFAGCMISTAAYDAGYTGFMATYLWPADRPFPIFIQLVSASSALICISAFILSLLNSHSNLRALKIVLACLLASLVSVVILALFIGYRDVIRYFSFLALVIVCALIVPPLISSRTEGALRLLLFLFLSPVLILIIARLLMLYGVISVRFTDSVGFSWALTALSPLIINGVLQRARVGQAKLAKLEFESQLRSQFLSQISHEFRSPLNIIINYANLVRNGSRCVTVSEALDAIEHSGYELLTLIDNILDYLRRDHDEAGLSVTDVSLGQFLDEMKLEEDRLARLSNNRTCYLFTGAIQSVARIDRARLQQVLRNLLVNANRYTENGIVTLRCHAEAVDTLRCRLSFFVLDTGIGIAPEDLQKIFEPYVRGSAAVKSAKKGFGIGLALSQRLLGTMGSRIVAKSHPGKGSEFSFSVECDMVELQETVENGSHGGLIAYTFLLVDDDPQMLRMLRNVLANYGVRLLTANSGEDAERHWAAGVDLVITDQFMDGGNGWNVLEKCASYRIPAILLSATEPKRPDGLSNDVQFNAFLQKPFNSGELLYEIRRALGTQLPEAEHQHLDQGIHSESLMHRPSAVSLEMLRRYLREGAYSEIERWVAEGETQHPEFGPFFAAVSGANARLDFPELRRLAGNDQEQVER